jgi:hypothetical protein
MSSRRLSDACVKTGRCVQREQEQSKPQDSFMAAWRSAREADPSVSFGRIVREMKRGEEEVRTGDGEFFAGMNCLNGVDVVSESVHVEVIVSAVV